MAQAYVSYMQDARHQKIITDLLAVLDIAKEQESQVTQIFEGLTFCVTGSVEHFKNRKDLASEIEKRGGKVTSSVTSKTHYLINNDVTSNSSKNKKAKDLNIPIISESTFVAWLESEEKPNV